MSKTLVIVESSAKSKTIEKYLGKDYIVKASFGHVRDLPQKELGVDIEDDFKPTYVISEGKSNVVKQLQTLAKSSDKVLLASDPDREGEAIAWHLYQLLKRHCKNIERIQFNEITKKAVIQAVSNPHDIDYQMVDSQQARRILDRIVGYQLSPWLNQVLSGRLSAGRVQSVALKIICDRENEIKSFIPEEYWKIYVNLTPQDKEFPFDAELTEKRKEKINIPNKEVADKILEDLKGKDYVVKDIEKKQKTRKPNPPFTTSTLQQEASKKLKWSSDRTMKVAQQLYEGIEIDDGQPHGLITYMRTDSTRINPDFQKETLDFILNKWGVKYKPTTPNIYKTKNDAQDAHEAIRPTMIEKEPDLIKKYLTNEQYLLYKLIWERYIASQMTPAIYDTVTVSISAADYVFKTSGSTLNFDGFMVLYQEEVDEDNPDNGEKEINLPQLIKDQVLKLIKIKPTQKFTTPPPRFTEATLIKELEKLGIGRPSTYATIISTLKNRNYVEIDKSRFIPTKLGSDVTDLLVKYFPDVINVSFTADMEEKLDLIAEGKMDWVDTLYEFYNPFSEVLDKAKKEVKVVDKEDKVTDKLCPNCGKPLVEKEGKHGKFLGCSGYPDCKTILPINDKYNDTGITCEKCGKPMIVKEYKKGRQTSKFLACIGYPDCKHTIPCDDNGKPLEMEKAEQPCPECGKEMILREGKTGKFWGCSGYPNCTKTLPYGETQPCPECGKDMYLRKGKTGKFWGCSGYPECTKTLPYGKTKPCPECGNPLVKRKGIKGDFWGCSNYPNCKYTENIK